MKYRVLLIASVIFILGNYSQAEEESASSLTDMVIQENIEGVTSGKDGKINFSANKALFNKSDNTLEMKDNVKIETDKGVSLETNSLKWNQSKDEVSTKDSVKIRKDKDIEVKGKGLDASPSLKKAKINENVEVKIPQEKSGFIMVNCKGPLEVDYQEGIATFHNEVKVNQKDSQIFSDKAVVYFDGETKKLTKIIAEGNVRIIRGKDTSFSEKAIYKVKEKKLLLKGDPRLVIFPESEQQFFE